MAQLVGSSPFFVPGPPAEIGHPSTSVADFLLKNARGRVLDIGGGNGAYSFELKKRGFSVTVAEVNPDALAAAAAAGLDVIDMKRTQWSELEGRFYTVLLIEVLEHISDYVEFLSHAFACASSRLLLTVPCNDDFPSLFAVNLTYNHIAVSDHVNHFTSADLCTLFDGLRCKYSLERGDPLFPWAFLSLMREQFRHRPLVYSLVLPLRILNKLRLIPRSYPTRCFVVASREV
jgi:SAM-dependent methyltransferase